MMRLNLVLLLAVMVSAVYLVSVQYDSRRLFTELDKAKTEAHRLDLENERLQVEKRAQTTVEQRDVAHVVSLEARIIPIAGCRVKPGPRCAHREWASTMDS